MAFPTRWKGFLFKWITSTNWEICQTKTDFQWSDLGNKWQIHACTWQVPFIDYLMDSLNLTLNGIVICNGACCSLMTRHVHTQNVQMFWKILKWWWPIKQFESINIVKSFSQGGYKVKLLIYIVTVSNASICKILVNSFIYYSENSLCCRAAHLDNRQPCVFVGREAVQH